MTGQRLFITLSTFAGLTTTKLSVTKKLPEYEADVSYFHGTESVGFTPTPVLQLSFAVTPTGHMISVEWHSNCHGQ